MSEPSSEASLRPVMCVVGARPNFMKMAPILRALAKHVPPLPTLLVHTGQHYDQAMSGQLFADLDLPLPDLNRDVGSGSHAVQTAEVMRRFEPALDAHRPSCVLVVGDVNSTLACTLVAVKKGVQVAHVEAGLRSYDRQMPEEINRIVTDQLADRLYTTERSALGNLLAEGIAAERVRFCGNVMIDSLLAHRQRAHPAADTLRAHGIDPKVLNHPRGYGVVTLHRPSNVDDPQTLRALLAVLGEVAMQLPLIFAMHPRTRSQIDKLAGADLIDPTRLLALPPQGYLEMLGLVAGASVVLADAGGLQEETTALGGRAILRAVDEILGGRGKRGRVPELWDGHAADRIASDLWHWLRPSAETH